MGDWSDGLVDHLAAFMAAGDPNGDCCDKFWRCSSHLDRVFISYLGLGIQPPLAWGNMLTGAQNYIFTSPSLALFPGVAIFLTVLAYNSIGDGLRDALDPRLIQGRT